MLNSSRYWKEIEGIAIEVTRESREQDVDLYEYLHEYLDAHEWVIYTANHYKVLDISPNDGAYVEDFGPEGIVVDGVLNTAVLAFAAMHRDVYDHSKFDAEPDDKDAD